MKSFQRRFSCFLVILMIFQCFGSGIVFADTPNDNASAKTISNWYNNCIVTTSTNPLEICGSNITINGDIHTNGNLLFDGSILNLKGTCESTGKINTNGWKINIDKKIENTVTMNVPNLYENIKNSIVKDSTIINQDKGFYDSNVTIEKPIIVDGNLSVNANKFNGKGYVLANKNIEINVSTINQEANNKLILCSQNGNINFNCNNANFNGIIYAPNGTVAINASNFIMNGKIIAKKVIFKGSTLNITNNYDDIKSYGDIIDICWENNNEIDVVSGNNASLSINAQNEYSASKLSEIKWNIQGTNIIGTGSNIKFIAPSKEGVYTINATLDDVTISKQISVFRNIIKEKQNEPIIEDDNRKFDPNADTDGDGIINSDELKYGTDYESIDTDDDGLSDYDEIYVYKTDPLNEDTDGDGIKDGYEVILGLDPLNKNIIQNQYKKTINKDELGASLMVNGSAKAVATTRIDKVDDDYLSSTLGITGNILEFSSEEKIDSATAKIKYDVDEVTQKGLSEDNLSIFYIDESNLELVKVNSIVDKINHTITANLPHFSKYVIGDTSKINTKIGKMDIIFAIDQSGSLQDNDPNNKRIDVSEKLVNQLSGDYRYGVVPFTDYAYAMDMQDSSSQESVYLTDKKDIVNNKLEQLRGQQYGGTDIRNAINSAINTFDNSNNRKIMVILTDGEDYSDMSSVITDAKNKNIQIYTVGLGDDVNVSLLRDTIAKPTSGQYYHADDADSLDKIFEQIRTNVTPPKTDKIDVKGNSVKVKVIADSKFRADVDGFKFDNFKDNLSNGNCYGFSAESIFYFDNKLPSQKGILSNAGVDYDLFSDVAIRNGKKLYIDDKDVDTDGFNYIETQIYDIYGHHIEQLTSDSRKYFEDRGYDIISLKTVDKSSGEVIYYESPKLNTNKLESATGWDDWDKQLLKSLIWWQEAQDNHNYDSTILSIDELKDAINNGPQLINFYGHKQGHAVVAQRLLQDSSDSNKYYLGIYDCNHPGYEHYIEINIKQVFFIGERLQFDAIDYQFDTKEAFYINAVRILKDDLN